MMKIFGKAKQTAHIFVSVSFLKAQSRGFLNKLTWLCKRQFFKVIGRRHKQKIGKNLVLVRGLGKNKKTNRFVSLLASSAHNLAPSDPTDMAVQTPAFRSIWKAAEA